MKKLALVLLLFLPAVAALAFGAKQSTNWADYPVTIHVIYSRYIFGDIPGIGHQELYTVIGGQQVELRDVGNKTVGVLALGDYKARLIATFTTYKEAEGYISKKPNGFDLCAVYQLLLPDGSTRDYLVIGLGPTEPYTTPPPAPANP